TIDPQCWKALREVYPPFVYIDERSPPDGVIFLRRLTSPTGERALVYLGAHPMRNNEVSLDIRVFDLASLFHEVDPLIPDRGDLLKLPEPTRHLCFFAGQIDPTDPSRFTVGYRADDKPGILEGHLVVKQMKKMFDADNISGTYCDLEFKCVSGPGTLG